MDKNNKIGHENSTIHFNEPKNIFISEWKKIIEQEKMQQMNENIGIGFVHPGYIEVNSIQRKDDEYIKIIDFLNQYKEYYSEQYKISIDELKLKFINYGKTELVYVLEEKDSIRKTLLVKQPAVPFGTVRKELDNLTELYKIDQQVVKPIDYFSYGEQELYVTPYIHQARCVASYDSWGMYVPEPYYRFVPFNKKQESIVTTCMIAKLVSFYNFFKEEGICQCKLGGGDFMLKKGWENNEATIDNTLNSLFFIAARDTVKCSFSNYLNMIRNEFSKSTINENQDNLIINLRGRVPISKDEIENGIELGKKLLDHRLNNGDSLNDCKKLIK